MAWEREAVASTQYLMRSEDAQVQGAIEQQKWLMGRTAAGRKRGYSFVGQAQQVLREYGIGERELGHWDQKEAPLPTI